MKSALFWGITQRREAILTDVLGHPIDPIFKGREMQIFDFFKLEDGTDKLSRNVGKEFLSKPRNTPEKCRSQGFYRLQSVCGLHRIWKFSYGVCAHGCAVLEGHADIVRCVSPLGSVAESNGGGRLT